MIKDIRGNLLLKGEFALERENIRTDIKGNMAKSSHPNIFGNKNTNKYIKVDFAESQIELITPVFSSIDETYNFLYNLQKIVSINLKDEYLWPQSNPTMLPTNEDEILLAQYGNKETTYREYLAKKYGKRRSVFSGVHFNFSFNEDTLGYICKQLNIDTDKSDELYLKLIKYVTKYSWLFVYLTGASPILHDTFKNDKGEPSINSGFSLRNSSYGYKNLENYILNYESTKKYKQSVEMLIKTGKLAKVSELYVPARLKYGYRCDSKNRRVPYIELRFLDLNPLFSLGINKEDLYMLHLVLVYFAMCDDFDFNEEMQKNAYYNKEQVALYGKIEILNDKGELVKMEDEALKLIASIENTGFYDLQYAAILKNMKEKINDITKTYSNIISNEISKKGYVGFHMDKIMDYLQEDLKTDFQLKGYEDMQLSTQCLLQSVIKKGLGYKVLDKSQNFIYVEHNGKEEYIKEATMTSADNYSTILVMENKQITKDILNKNNIKTPQGVVLNSLDEGITYYEKAKNMYLVIKPNNTNFGKGITILNTKFNFEDYKRALKRAFEEDSVVLVEEFVQGKEYRFLVIGGVVEAVLHRRGANVVGDGVSTIKELVKIKNASPLRSKGYKTPLFTIEIGDIEKEFLEKQGLSVEHVPDLNQRVFLRENSNVSTGGDSIDYTDIMGESYKEIAINAARCVNAQICGVDMMIPDINEKANKENYAVIELNFNPAIFMHCYPSEGTKRSIGDKIINLLFNID